MERERGSLDSKVGACWNMYQEPRSLERENTRSYSLYGKGQNDDDDDDNDDDDIMMMI